MPRRSRHFIPGTPLHLIQRGNNRHACYFREADYSIYLAKLLELSLKFHVSIHSYVLMTNHVHLLLTPSTPTGVSQLLQSLGSYYVRYINSTYNRTGTLWEGRFKSSLVNSDEYLFTVSRYIEMNPVRANMVDHPAEYPWSSYRFNALGKANKLITPHTLYLSLGKTNQNRQATYRAYFESLIPDLTLEQIRIAANKGWVLGNAHFKAQIEKQLGQKLPPFKRGGDHKSRKFRQG